MGLGERKRQQRGATGLSRPGLESRSLARTQASIGLSNQARSALRSVAGRITRPPSPPFARCGPGRRTLPAATSSAPRPTPGPPAPRSSGPRSRPAACPHARLPMSSAPIAACKLELDAGPSRPGRVWRVGSVPAARGRWARELEATPGSALPFLQESESKFDDLEAVWDQESQPLLITFSTILSILDSKGGKWCAAGLGP